MLQNISMANKTPATADANSAESEPKLGFAFDAAGQGVWDADTAKNTVVYSPMWRIMRGFDPDEVVDSSTEAWLERVHPDDRQRILSTIADQNSGKIPRNAFEYRERHREGHYIWILSRGRPIAWFPDGRPSRVVGTDTDITTLKEAEDGLRFANTLLTTQMETSPDAILVVDANARIVSFNQRFAMMWQVPTYALDAKDDGPVLAAVMSAQKDPEVFFERVRYLYEHPAEDGHDLLETKDGRFIDRFSGVLREANGTYLGRVWFFRDNTVPIVQAQQLELQNFRFAAALDNMAQGLCMFGRDTRLVVSNLRYAEMYGLAPESVTVGMTQKQVIEQRLAAGNQPTESSDTYVAWLLDVSMAGKPANYLVELLDGRAIRIRHQPLSDGSWVATHEDVTEQRRDHARIEHLARHDPLTDLPNRTFLNEHLANVTDRIRRGDTFGLICVDLDGFKGVNDLYGHATGDALLVEASRRLSEASGAAEMVARLGGDEFVIVRGLISSSAEFAELGDRLVKSFADPFEIDGHHILMGASVGIAIAPSDGLDGETLMKNADLAMYRAKQAGRGTYYFYEKGLDSAAKQRLSLETALRDALSRNEFRLVYQPLMNLADGRICSFEALLRWKHPEHGNIPPSEFIPIAEETGLIAGIGQWVLNEACREAARWPDDIGIAVNLSPVQFKHSGSLVQHVMAALATSKVRPNRLELEITESVLLAEDQLALPILQQLKQLGVRVAMDDFGTGYSSLSYLRRFPFDKIKIDQSFIRDLSTSEDSRAIVRAVIGLGRSLGMTTTAEGVETEAQLAMVNEEGCAEVQGYFISPPLPPSSVDEMIKMFSRSHQMLGSTAQETISEAQGLPRLRSH
jgi:diguanylate cyclase (GGDEF)-like protein/PAS domain S-box-containing protein